ncbi:hypothetical protein L7F22_063901 [Adiantum nelumboides]|nr:hypothetical protein [Adiantum nelumboides]
MESFATPYPLIFFDGEQEQDKGFVGIHSVLTFKRFQSLLSQKTGISPNQLSTVFVCRKTFKGSEKKQRLPINGNTNFNILLNQHNPTKERDCFFLVSVKKSKKERKGSRKRGAESEMPEDWEINNYMAAVGGNGHSSNHSMEETLSQGSAGSAETNACLKSAFSKHHSDNGLDSSRATDNKADRVILKRGNASFLQKHGWSQGERQPSQQAGGFLPDEYMQLNSPRFAALRPEDQRDLNWKWEEAFPRVPRVKPREQWDVHSSFVLPHNTTSQADVEYHPYNIVSFPEEHVIRSNLQRKGRLINSFSHTLFRHGVAGDPHTRSPFRSREFLHANHQKPSFLAPRASYGSAFGSINEVDVHRERDAFFEGNSRLHHLVEVDWQKLPAVSGVLSDMQDTSNIESSINEEASHSLFCQLCFECRRRNVTPIPFHWCVEDTVTNGFQGPSPAGPIGRRDKTFHIEAAA